ncbi:MAG: prepilin-type N-terminal cleavage/methylation domain-containing protein, partial [Oscillospiraceae bacterium]|nr:prepilin-type N-terminal cleavage/methylation domain-containing protein [Oscillospiraceae bacterium]
MNKKGFSLVELMIVVVIMGILIAVAIPLYGAITKNANNKTCA